MQTAPLTPEGRGAVKVHFDGRTVSCQRRRTVVVNYVETVN